MDPREFHALAGRLAAGGAAAERRTAIGRSYYAVFNVAAEHLRNIGFSISRGAAAHGEIQKCLINSGDAAVAAVASNLTDLHSSRNRADYHLEKVDVEKRGTALGAVTLSGQMIQSLDTAFLGPQRMQLHAAILKWRWENGYR